MRVLPFCPALAAGLVVLAFGACSSDGPAAPADVIYQGIASDEAWLELEDHVAAIDDASAPRLLAPLTISRAGDAPTFSYDGGAVALAYPRPGAPASHATRFAWNEVVGVGRARAHMPPVTGAVYRLVFTIPGDAAPVRVLTGLRTYMPDATVWDRMKVATGSISLELVGAYFSEGRVTEGPFRAAEPFSIPVE